MGNVVVMAVNHSELDAIAKMDFKDLARSRHRPDSFPKEFNGQPSWLSTQHYHYEETKPGVVFSNYYHASSAFCLYVDDQMLVSPGHLSYSLSNLDSTSSFDIKPVISRARSDLPKKRWSLLSANGNSPRSERAPGSKVSLFLIFTDHMTTAEDNPHTMEDVAEYCRSGTASERTFFRTSSGIMPIGTLAEDQACFLVVRDYNGSIITLPRNVFEFSSDEKKAVVSFQGSTDFGQAMDEMEFLITREICGSFGYIFSKKP